MLKDGIPLIVCEGTGGCVDLLVECLLLVRSSPSSSSVVEDRLKAKCSSMFDLQCLTRREKLFSSIDLRVHRTHHEFASVILLALLNGNSSREEKIRDVCVSRLVIREERNLSEQLKFVLEWNRVDLVEKFVLREDEDWNVNLSSHFFSLECLFRKCLWMVYFFSLFVLIKLNSFVCVSIIISLSMIFSRLRIICPNSIDIIVVVIIVLMSIPFVVFMVIWFNHWLEVCFILILFFCLRVKSL